MQPLLDKWVLLYSDNGQPAVKLIKTVRPIAMLLSSLCKRARLKLGRDDDECLWSQACRSLDACDLNAELLQTTQASFTTMAVSCVVRFSSWLERPERRVLSDLTSGASASRIPLLGTLHREHASTSIAVPFLLATAP